MIFNRLLALSAFLVPIFIVFSCFVIILGPRFKSNKKTKKRTYGEVKEVKEYQGIRIVIVEFIVDGNTYRCVDKNYGYVVTVGEYIEVFYDTLDPREASIGRILQGDLNTITCSRCVGPVNINEPVCPYCGFLLTPEIYDSTVHDKPIKESKRILNFYKRGIPVFLLAFFTIVSVMIFVSLYKGDYESFANSMILLLIALIIIFIYYIKNNSVYDSTTSGEMVYVHEQTLSKDDVRNWAVVAEFQVGDRTYRSVDNCSLVCYNECEEVIIKYNSADPRKSEINKFK